MGVGVASWLGLHRSRVVDLVVAIQMGVDVVLARILLIGVGGGLQEFGFLTRIPADLDSRFVSLVEILMIHVRVRALDRGRHIEILGRQPEHLS